MLAEIADNVPRRPAGIPAGGPGQCKLPLTTDGEFARGGSGQGTAN